MFTSAVLARRVAVQNGVVCVAGCGTKTSRANIFLPKSLQLSYLPCIKYIGLPVSVSCPVYRNVNDEESLPLVSVSKGCTSLL